MRGERLAVLGVVNGNALSPPELAADVPVVNVLKPFDEDLGVPLGNELDLAGFENLNIIITEIV